MPTTSTELEAGNLGDKFLKRMDVNLSKYEVGKTLFINDVVPDFVEYSDRCVEWFKEMMDQSAKE